MTPCPPTMQGMRMGRTSQREESRAPEELAATQAAAAAPGV